MIRWDLTDVVPGDDYVLRLTAEGRLNSTNSVDQIARAYVYNIRIQQAGAFIIDTQPPDAVLFIDNDLEVTNKLDHMVDIYADDEATAVTKCSCTNATAPTSDAGPRRVYGTTGSVRCMFFDGRFDQKRSARR